MCKGQCGHLGVGGEWPNQNVVKACGTTCPLISYGLY